MATDQTNNSSPSAPANLPESVADMPMDVHVTIGRTNLLLKDIFKMTVGSMIELEQPADEMTALVANGKVTARGRLVIVRGNYGLKVVTRVVNDKSGR